MSKYASADSIKGISNKIQRNSEQIGVLVESIKKLVREFRRVDLRKRLEIASERLYKLERQYSSGLRQMSVQTKGFHQRLIEDKKYLEEQLRK